MAGCSLAKGWQAKLANGEFSRWATSIREKGTFYSEPEAKRSVDLVSMHQEYVSTIYNPESSLINAMQVKPK